MEKESVPQNNSLKKSKEADTPILASHTITEENIFKKFTHNEVFPLQEYCLNYIKNKKKLYMFGEDKTTKGNKKFFALDHNTIYSLSAKKKFHLYEYFSQEDKLKLFLDIDIKPENIPKNVNKTEYFNNILDKSINTVTTHLEKYNITNPQYIILFSCGAGKLSAHIIFNDVIFKNIEEMLFFMSNIKSSLIDDKIIDMKPYRKTGCFRMLWSSKCGTNRILEFYKAINYTHNNDKQLFMDCLLRNIPKNHQLVEIKLPKNVKVIKKIKPKKAHHVVIGEYKKTNYPISLLQKYVDILDASRADDYNDWLKVGMVLHNCTPTPQCFDIWDEWSKKSACYGDRDFNGYKWNGFKCGYFSIGTLKYYAKMDNPEKYGDIEYSLEKAVYDTTKFTNNYLLDRQDEKIKDNKSFVARQINNWMNGNHKILSIKSTYDTGKTSVVYKIIDEFNVKRVLFISYRQTLTNDLYGNFKDLGVESYLDKKYGADKVICQIESLHKLLPSLDFIDDEDDLVPPYDLVIIDEIESILNHFRSSTIKDKEYTFDIFRDLVFNSSKVLALDGDFHNRSYHFLKHFEEPIILENEVKKNKMNFIFSNNCTEFERKIDTDLSNGKNICVVSMSSKLAVYYDDKYNGKYKTVLHCARSDDKYKEELKDVKSFWKQFQLVVYSPSIESGVNFDAEHFHKIYVILSSKSTSPRGLMQMIARVRKLEDRNIMVYLNNMPFREKGNFYTYDEVKQYVCETLHKYVKPKTVLNSETNKMVIRYKFDLYEQILVHNETETSNKTRNLFVPYLIKLLTEKGHIYERVEIRRNKNAYDKDILTKDEILKADDINQSQFNMLLSKQIENEASREDKIKVERFMIRKDWKIDGEITGDFLTKFYGKTGTLLNLRWLLDKSKLKVYLNDMDDKYKINFDVANKLKQIEMIQEVINKLGFNGIGTDQRLDKETFQKNVDDVIGSCELFIDPNKSQPMFGYDKNKIRNINTNRQFMGFINSLFSEWGIVIKCTQKYTCTRTKNTKTTIAISYYSLHYKDNINNYI